MASKKKLDSTVVAKTDDGSVQITLIIPWKKAEDTLSETASELGKDYSVAGFRKGKAPLDRLLKQIPRETLVQETLQKILPEMFGKAISDNKITPGMYPRFEILVAEDDKDWQVRATTCEMPTVSLGDYKQSLKLHYKKAASRIWTPKDGKEEKKEMTREEKEQEAMKTVLESVEIKLPKVLIDQEVNSRLASLLERIEKLGLTLESYLSSVGKTPESLRNEYWKTAEATMRMEFVLSKIAQEEKLDPAESEVEAFIQASAADPSLAKQFESEEQKQVIKSVLRKRKALDMLVALGS